MKTTVIGALVLSLISTSASAWVSCENDKICSGTQICKDGYCQEKEGANASGSAKPARKEGPVRNLKKVTPDAPLPK